MSKITRNYIYNLIYQLFVLIVPLVTAPYIARKLGSDGTGVFSYVHSVTALVCTFVMLGIYNYGNRKVAYVRDDRNKLSETFWEIMGARLVIALFGTVTYCVIVLLLGKYRLYFAIYYLYLLAYFIDCTWLYVGVEEMKWAVIKNATTKVLSVIGIFVFVNSKDDLWLYFLIQSASLLLSNLLSYSQLRLFIDFRMPIFKSIFNDLKGAFILFLPSVANTIYLQCDKIMIETMTNSTSQVAFYDYSEKIVTIPLTFITVVSTVMMPRIANEFSKGNETEIARLLNKAAKFSAFLAFPMMFGLIAVADKMVPWYLGEEFASTALAICIISPIVVSNSLAGVSGGQYFTATNQVNFLIRSQVGAAIGNIILNAILIPQMGFVGAAVATVFSSLFCAVYQYYYLVRQVSMPDFFRECLKYFVSGLIMFMTVYVLTKSLSPNFMTTMVQVIIGVAVYFTLLFLLKDEQIRFIYSYIKRKSGDLK